ncbi:trimeric intracellular cation channel family protein [Aliiroseovarius lamellibrachiae]|uniref:trimeric intracellular cation channel family protein n=1 Tax=Aliiroseovarius lamellibrachiae TaxID=1924933 RepID=UPI001BE02467|nr:trimeric intracellular cation channel family protein [Aliiroseovarius lamellibrachiae]MBT2130730.1 trimeric intracellular cation channel family protein [Aliiroseovarius lamellibrachiae]
METLSFLFVPLTLLATAVMAASAAIQAHRAEMDPFGATVLAIATAMGGGTLRDLFLGLTPVFWIRDERFLAVAVPIALISFAVATRMSAGNGRRLKALMHLDAIGLALFTLTGVQVALDAGISPILAVVLGCITGTAGGMIRDLLCNMTPSLLKEDLYATLSLIGGALYIVLLGQVDGTLAAGISFAAILLARIVVLNRTPAGDQV